jgi:hypothetical protein
MRQVFLLCIVLLIAPFALAATSAPLKPFTEPQTGYVFPLKMGTMAFTSTDGYSHPSLGLSVHYQTDAAAEEIWADVYIYDQGLKNIPDGSDSDAVKAAFEESQKSVLALEKRGNYKDVKTTIDKPLVVKAGDKEVTFQSATFEYVRMPEKGSTDSPQAVVSHLLITASRGYFIKVRFSYDAKAKDTGAKTFIQFVTDLGAVLGQKPSGKTPPGRLT